MKTFVFTLLISILVIAFSFSEAKAVDKDVVLALSFDDGQGAEDLSSNQNHGTLMGDPQWEAEGKFGGALVFDGDDFVEVANESNFDFERADSFSIAAWIKTTMPNDGFVVAKQQNSGSYRGYEINFNGTYIQPHNSLKFSLQTQSGQEIDTAALGKGGKELNDGEWHQIVAVYTGTGNADGIKRYVDGEAVEEISVVNDRLGDTILNDVPLTIGSRDGGGVPFNGLIDEVLIVKRALSEEEIRAHFLRGLAGVLAAVQPEGKLTATWGLIKASY